MLVSKEISKFENFKKENQKTSDTNLDDWKMILDLFPEALSAQEVEEIKFQSQVKIQTKKTKLRVIK